jgi:hypothetical protein
MLQNLVFATLVAGFPALGITFFTPLNDILNIKGLRFSAVDACLYLLPQLIETDLPQSVLVFKQSQSLTDYLTGRVIQTACHFLVNVLL